MTIRKKTGMDIWDIPILSAVVAGRKIRDFFSYVLQEIKNELAIPELSYKQLLKDVMDNKPEDDSIEYASAIKRKTDNDKLKILVVYLDADKKPVIGKKYSFAISAKSIDKELDYMFGNKDIIIFE